MIVLPFLSDLDGVLGELSATVELCELAHDAIRERRVKQLEDLGEAGRGELERLQTQSSLLIAHSIFEFAIKQLAQHLELETGVGSKKVKAASEIERLALRISNVIGGLEATSSDDWEVLIALSKIRNLIAHATGFQDRDFTMHEISLLGSRGIRHAVAIGEPPLKAFFLEAKAVDEAVKVFSRLLVSIFSDVEQWDAQKC